MAVRQQDIEFYGSASMADDDATLDIGGAVSTSTRISLSDMAVAGNVQVVSDNAGDTTQTVTVDAINASGITISEGKVLAGQSPVVMTVNTDWRDLLKAVKSATTAGTVAVESVTAETTGTAQGGAVDTITLAAGESAVDDFFKGMPIRCTAGTGSGQIARIIAYNGTTKVATLSRDVAVAFDATSVYRISRGVVFERAPHEVLEVRRLFYLSEAEASGGANRAYYDKFYVYNLHATLALTNSTIAELADAPSLADFDLEATLDGTDTNGAGNNRQVAPAGYTFDSTTKNIANSQNLTAGSGQGVWGRLTLAAGEPAGEFSWSLRASGSTVA